MKKTLIIIAAIVGMSGPAIAQEHVRGYYRHDGTYVAPHEQTLPNDTRMDNYSTRGNVNPYTGQQGTVNPYATPQPYRAPTYNAPSYQPEPKVCPHGVYSC